MKRVISYSRTAILVCFIWACAGGWSVVNAQTVHWQATNGPFGGTVITEMATHPDGDLFAGTEGGLFRSSDRGQIWSQIDTHFGSNAIRSIVFTVDNDVLVGTLGSGIYISPDKGNSWLQAGLSGLSVTALATNASGDLFAGTSEGSIYRSTDHGVTWVIKRETLFPSEITALTAGPNGILLAGTHGGIFRSGSNGDAWEGGNGGLSTYTVTDIAYSGFGGFFACTDEGDIYRSTSLGSIWSKTLSTTQTIRSLFVKPTGEILAGTVQGIIRLSNAGIPVQDSYHVGYVIVESITMDHQGAIYAGTFGGGVFRSDYGGYVWTPKNTGLGSIVSALAFNQAGMLFAGTYGGGVFRSTDKGQTWAEVNIGLQSLGVEALVINDDGEIFAGTSGGHVFRSANSGNTWQQTNFPGWAVRGLFLNDNGDLFAGTTFGLFRLPRQSNTWVYTSLAGFDIKASAIAPGGEMYASLPDRLMRSPDNGNTWGAAGLLDEVQCLAINNRGDVYAGLTNGGAYLSINTGEPAQTWNQIDATLPVKDARAFTFTPSGHVFIATYGGGVYRSTNGGYTWAPINTGLSNLFALAFAIHPIDGSIFLGTNAGVFINIDPTYHTSSETVTYPEYFTLQQNYPNPFNPVTTIPYSIPNASHVTLGVYDLLGRELSRLVDAVQAPGVYAVTFDAHDLPSGIYLYRLQAGTQSTVRLLTILK